MPVDFPSNVFVANDTLLPELGIAQARGVGGLIVTSRKGDPFWRGTITTPALPISGPGIERMLRSEFVAWLHWAADLNMRIDFVPPRYRLPRSYTDATWPMTGDGAIVSVTDARTIVVSGLTVGLILKRGDRIALTHDDTVLHRWIGQNVVVSSDTAQTIVLTPRLPVFNEVDSSFDVVLEDPPMQFMVVAGSIVAPETLEPAPVAFDVSEVIIV